MTFFKSTNLVILLYLIYPPLILSAETKAEPIDEIKLYNGGWSKPMQEYNISLLRAALEASIKDYGPYSLSIYPDELSLERADRMLEEGVSINCRVDSFRVDLAEGSKYQSILLPSHVNIMGLSVMIANQDSRATLSALDSVAEFLQLSAGQGYQWPDALIYEQHGIRVSQVRQLDKLLPMLEKKRFDYFPLSVMEAKQFLLDYKEGKDELFLNTDHYIFYAMPFYLAFPTKQPEIAERIIFGTEKLYQNGKLKIINDLQFGHFKRSLNPLAHIFVLNNPFESLTVNDDMYRDAYQEYFKGNTNIHKVPRLESVVKRP